MKHRLFAEPYSAAHKTWTVYVMNEGVVFERIRADTADIAIQRVKNKIKKLYKDIWEEE